jgi:gamma-glutamyltranspeptidase / glutathione hydrolase
MSDTSHRQFRTRLRQLIAIIAAAVILFIGSTHPAVAAEARHAMVAAESDLAAKAGVEILKRGGNAIDAAAATSLALGVTNASSCGIGGGGFMLIYWAKTGTIYALDYRERAPMAAHADMYMRNGKPDEELAVTGPLAVAVPGEIAGLDTALRRFGTMKFQQVAAPAIKLARDGFPLSSNVARELVMVAPKISNDPGFREVYFSSAAAPLKAGDIARASKLAALMERLGNDPAATFYHGPIAGEIAHYMRERGGLVTTVDLADYRPVWREPIHLFYRDYNVYSMPPPSSGGVVLEILGMLSSSPLAGLGLDSPPYLARLIEVMRQGFVDRAQYADPAYANVPIAQLLSISHIAAARDRAFHHKAPPSIAAAYDHGTSNFCVVDKDGNVVAVTTTVNTIFGSKMMIASLGLILNDEMDDFAVAPGIPNTYKLIGAKANEVAPGKRPLSSMSPTIVMLRGRPVLVLGGSGGPTIISGVVQVALNVLDFHLDPEQAVAEPRIHEQAQPNIVFVDETMAAKTRNAIEQMGYKLKTVPRLGAISAIRIAPGKLHGAFDPEKGGGVEGY